jgi:DNA-binding CsgD family transcriptional regulator
MNPLDAPRARWVLRRLGGAAGAARLRRVTHRNPALAALLAALLAADAEAKRLEAEITRVGAAVGAVTEPRGGKAAPAGPVGGPALREVRTAVGRHRLHASYAGRELLGPAAAVLVLVARREAPELTAAHLRAHYGLTPREVAVAYLLARGRSNAAIARLLALSPATARHHTEHALAKLGLRSRARLAARLGGGLPDAGGEPGGC